MTGQVIFYSQSVIYLYNYFMQSMSLFLQIWFAFRLFRCLEENSLLICDVLIWPIELPCISRLNTIIVSFLSLFPSSICLIVCMHIYQILQSEFCWIGVLINFLILVCLCHRNLLFGQVHSWKMSPLQSHQSCEFFSPSFFNFFPSFSFSLSFLTN